MGDRIPRPLELLTNIVLRPGDLIRISGHDGAEPTEGRMKLYFGHTEPSGPRGPSKEAPEGEHPVGKAPPEQTYPQDNEEQRLRDLLRRYYEMPAWNDPAFERARRELDEETGKVLSRKKASSQGADRKPAS